MRWPHFPLLPDPLPEVYRDGRGDEAGRDGVGVAFAVGGVDQADGRDLEAHLPGRLAWVAVAALELDRLYADRPREVARRQVAVLRRLPPRLDRVVVLALQHEIPLARLRPNRKTPP